MESIRMSEQDSIWSRFPPDLMGTVVLTGFTIVFTFAPIISATALRVIFTGVFLLFAPGYTVLAILFPESADSDTESISIDTIERAGLSIPLSFVTVPIVGLILSVSPLNFAVMPLTIILGVFVSGGCVIASWRRQSLPVTIQYRPRPRTRMAAFSNTPGQGMSTRSFLTITAVGLIILVSFSGAGYLFAAPGQGEAYTELYLGNETQNTIQSMKAYQTTYSVGDTQTLTVGISNREHQSMQYTLVSELQRVNNSTGTLQITERQELGRYSISLGSDQTWQRQDRIRPQLQGEQLRLIYYLYLDDSPSTPSVDTAAQEVHLWISVTSS
jgi:uncharacterized membrane protein